MDADPIPNSGPEGFATRLCSVRPAGPESGGTVVDPLDRRENFVGQYGGLRVRLALLRAPGIFANTVRCGNSAAVGVEREAEPGTSSSQKRLVETTPS